jgi:DNA excision repair protein ERCC-2
VDNVTYEIAVRTLCEFTAKRGDLDMRFTPSPSALEGMAGHRIIASRRGPSFQTELSLQAEYGLLRVRGRADGYDAEADRLEEFKTYRGDLGRMPENHRALHWAQLRIYGWLLCKQKAKDSLRLALVYLDIASEQETVFEEIQSAAQLEQHFAAHCEQFIRWAESEGEHRCARDATLRAIVFPFAAIHPGQKVLARGVYRQVRAGGALLAQAPTGIGKTIGTLYPALKGLAASQLDKLFYLVPKTSGRQLALDALRQMRLAKLRIVELVARGKACEYPGLPCDGAVCPLARGFYARLPAARAEAIESAFLDQGAVREIARRHHVCPYYLGQELARWSDVLVGDYNYYFDRSGMLYGWTVTHQWRVCLLIDEAHNLVERARAMYTACLDQEQLQRALRNLPATLRRAFLPVLDAWNEVTAGSQSYRVLEQLPRGLLVALERFIAALLEHQQAEADPSESLHEVLFAALGFARLAAEFDASTLFEIQPSTLCLRNVVPGRFLAQRFAAAHASVLFSATLTPHGFFRDILGLPRTAGWLDVESPFRPEQLAVHRVPFISTRFRHRQRSLAPIAQLLVRQFSRRPGNYLVFVSSFEYLDRLVAAVNERHPQIPTWKQLPAMKEPDRDAFLARFTPEGRGAGFAVLGGAFAEGIDLPGSRLIGVFVATLGLPQVNAVNQEMQRRMDTLFGAGYEYTYLYPGIQKVVQAAGRVIRTPSDYGVLYLIDDRYSDPKVLRLLPQWWSLGLSELPPSAASLSP